MTTTPRLNASAFARLERSVFCQVHDNNFFTQFLIFPLPHPKIHGVCSIRAKRFSAICQTENIAIISGLLYYGHNIVFISQRSEVMGQTILSVSEAEQTKRNFGIDFLRIVSMFMVVVLHVLGQGGILAHAEPLSVKYWAAWLLEIACYCVVNCFALISGYVMHQSNFKFSKIFRLWLQTVFYTGLAVIIFSVFRPNAVGKRTMLSSILPITSSQYWYISAYFGMLILVPLLNTVITYTSKKVLDAVLLSAFILFCIFPVMLQTDPYSLSSGYSMIWLILLYLVGGYMHKYSIANKIKTSYSWFIVLALVAISFLTKFIIEQFLHTVPLIVTYKNALISYTSPTIVFIAVGLLIAFSKLNFKPRAIKIVHFISPAVLGVYLAHVNPLVWNHIIKDFAISFLNYNCVSMVGLIVLSALLIFIICIMIDLVRIKLFALLKVDKLCSFLETWLTKTRGNV